MKAQNLIGLTIAEATKKIKRAESHSDLYLIDVCTKEHKERNLKNFYKRQHLHNENGERVYKIIEYDLITFAKNEELQKRSFILDVEIKQEEHDNWSFSGFVSTSKHNVYYLYIDGIAKGNKGNEIIQNRKEHLIAFKKGELTKAQRRFTL